MEDDASTPPKYDVAIVECVVLELAAELHPRHLGVRELALRIVGDPDDTREVETVAEAIRSLRHSDLLCDRDDEIVEPTRAALRAVELLVCRPGQ